MHPILPPINLLNCHSLKKLARLEPLGLIPEGILKFGKILARIQVIKGYPLKPFAGSRMYSLIAIEGLSLMRSMIIPPREL